MSEAIACSPHSLDATISIVGCDCQLPGAHDVESFWRILDAGLCVVSDLPAGRWHKERFYNPRIDEPGFSYSFFGGYLDDPFLFDPVAFGISPREATQMDPQQRLLLEVTAGALDDAGIAASSLTDEKVGVYVGASSLDYGNTFSADPAAIGSQFMTGNTLSILANRLSYIFNFKGPSFVVDTACSSSLIAFAQAVADLESGRADIAIVAGVNLLLSPAPFIGFSRATMLSPTGLCRPFSAKADGYVRAEGAVALVLARDSLVQRHGWTPRGNALAARANCDGRTSGIALPSMEGQRALLDEIYGPAGFDPARLAFVEAHGTGTRVGDPTEATAIGESLGLRRTRPLPIGSVKSNIGHLEPASGLAGVLKALLALENRRLPPSLHLDEINPDIDFDALNLAPARESVALGEGDELLYAGVSSFGFGGANAHVLLGSAPAPERKRAPAAGNAPEFLCLSAHSREALTESARTWAEKLAEPGADLGRLAAANAWRRELGNYRLVQRLTDAGAAARALSDYAEGGDNAAAYGLETGAASAAGADLAFVFSGNGSQWAGMGVAAFEADDSFRRQFLAVDALFEPLAGWSLAAALTKADLGVKLKHAGVAQPMLFAIQAALTGCLRERGIMPKWTLGHSVGEVAAAYASGALDLQEAVRLVIARSAHQEAMRGLGGMAVAAADEATVLDFIARLDLDLEIAAINGPSSTTVSGPSADIKTFHSEARRARIASRILDIEYPFHSSLLEPAREPLLAALAGLRPKACDVGFISTVTGALATASALDADYWWRNVREPVRFSDAVAFAAAQGAGLFVEIGPHAILTSPIADTLREAGSNARVIGALSESDKAANPVAAFIARILAHGGQGDAVKLFGDAPRGRIALPALPWQRKSFRPAGTSQALNLYAGPRPHALLGVRLQEGGSEWRNVIDAGILPYLADHRIDGEIVVPGSGLAEMALAAARELFPTGPVGLADFDLVHWLSISPDAMQETSVRYDSALQTIQIFSRPRLGANEWTLNARGRILAVVGEPDFVAGPLAAPVETTPKRIYDVARDSGVDYGESFRRVLRSARDGKDIDIELAAIDADEGAFSGQYVLHPIALDAAFHALFPEAKLRAGTKSAHLPIRFADLRVYRDNAAVTRARIVQESETIHSLAISIALYGEDGGIVATMRGGLFRSVVLADRSEKDVYYRQTLMRMEPPAGFDAWEIAAARLSRLTADAMPDSWLLMAAFARALAHEAMVGVFGEGTLNLDALAASGAVAEPALPLARLLLNFLGSVGLASETPAGWTLAPQSGLPPARDILGTFAAEAPSANAEITLGAFTLAHLANFLRDGAAPRCRPALIELFERFNLHSEPALTCAVAICADLAEKIAPEPLRVLIAQPGCAGLVGALQPLARAGKAVLTVAGRDARKLGRTALQLGSRPGVEFLELVDGAKPGAAFHVAFGLALDGDLADDPALVGALARRLPAKGVLAILQPPSDMVFDIFWGLKPYGDEVGAPHFVPPGLERIERALRSAGSADRADIAEIKNLVLGEGLGHCTLARPATVGEPRLAASGALVLHGDAGAAEFGSAVAAALTLSGVTAAQAAIVDLEQATSAGAGSAGQLIVYCAPMRNATAATEVLTAEIAKLAALLAAAPNGVRFCLAVRGLEPSDTGVAETDDAGVAEALWDFARVAVNEYPELTIDCADLAPDLAIEDAASRLVRHLAEDNGESEILIDAAGRRTPRVIRGLKRQAPGALAPLAELEFSASGGLSRFDWVEGDRRAPENNEVEVEIAATGLNFRDVMFALGLLDDDVLDAGLAGAVMGFECSGRVVRVGPEVKTLRAGDAVMGFARRSFATFVTASEEVFVPLPEGVSLEAAATTPVAFLTAWHSLVHLARIQPGEWVLVHGAAGGVGLAALQIARLKGARIAATVGTSDKRALAAFFGAEKIYDSRRLGFADEIRAEIGGVDVVLNSLSGDAMRAGVACLKPFGRFIELGKRDYVANSALPLRPFRRNLTYFGVDVDQLLAHDLGFATAMMRELSQHFATGALTALPFTLFEAHEASNAFRLMQSAGHIGKILIRPAKTANAARSLPTHFTPAEGVHLVVGGAGGFGFETAVWLAEKGAQTVVVASRRGVLAPELELRAEALRQTGVRFVVEQVDVTQAKSVASLIARIAPLGPLRGVFHTAVTLDDAMIGNLTETQLASVLAPKVEGARLLDRATRGLALDAFVVFSSATTLIGNPGQAAYVAANGYMQGLIRRRRALGLPGLAVGWGAISDAGLLAGKADIAASLERVTGVAGMKTAEALAHLGDLLSRSDVEPVVYCASIRATTANRRLKLLGSPTFANLFAGTEEDQVDELDLKEILASKTPTEAREYIVGVLAQEVAHILRIPADEIDPNRPLSELGMDSLMGLELRLSLETRLGVELPLVSITSVKTIGDLGLRVMELLQADNAGDQEVLKAQNLATLHMEESLVGQITDTGIDEIEALLAEMEKDSKKTGALL